MSNMKNKWIFLLVNIVISIVLFFISSPVYTLIYFINSLFYIALLYIILFLFLFIIKGRFFDGISWSFRRFGLIMSKKRDYLAELEDTPELSSRISNSFYRFIAFQTFFLIVLLIVLLGVYYSLTV